MLLLEDVVAVAAGGEITDTAASGGSSTSDGAVIGRLLVLLWCGVVLRINKVSSVLLTFTRGC